MIVKTSKLKKTPKSGKDKEATSLRREIAKSIQDLIAVCGFGCNEISFIDQDEIGLAVRHPPQCVHYRCSIAVDRRHRRGDRRRVHGALDPHPHPARQRDLDPARRGLSAHANADATGLDTSCAAEAEANKGAADRKGVLDGLERQLRKGDKALIGNSAYHRFLKSTAKKAFEIDPGKVADEARFDGILVLRTNAGISPLQAVLRYRDLLQVEDLFRTAKALLRIRPGGRA